MKILGLVLACGMLGTSVNAVTSDPTANAQNRAGLIPSGQPMIHDKMQDEDVKIDARIRDMEQRIAKLPANSDLAEIGHTSISVMRDMEKLRLLYQNIYNDNEYNERFKAMQFNIYYDFMLETREHYT